MLLSVSVDIFSQDLNSEGLSKAFHYPVQLQTFYLLLWNRLLILKILTEILFRITFSVIGRCSLVWTSHWVQGKCARISLSPLVTDGFCQRNYEKYLFRITNLQKNIHLVTQSRYCRLITDLIPKRAVESVFLVQVLHSLRAVQGKTILYFKCYIIKNIFVLIKYSCSNFDQATNADVYIYRRLLGHADLIKYLEFFLDTIALSPTFRSHTFRWEIIPDFYRYCPAIWTGGRD